MSVFIYNGVTINNPEIKTIASEAVYDQADLSVMFTRMTYRVQGVIKTDVTYSMAQNLVTLRQTLLVPRRGLLVGTSAATVDAILNLGNGAANDFVDDVGGPKPRRCEVTEIVGTTFAYVVFEIEVGIQEGCNTTGDIISHAYQVAHAYDNRFYCARTVNGKIRIKNGANASPDSFRGIVTPTLPDGFRRESMAFVLSYDQLELDYTIRDQEVFRVAPLSAEDAQATFSEQMSNYIWYSHFTMELKGNKFQDQLSMMNAIYEVAQSRINFGQPGTFIQQMSIDEELYDNTVRFQITVMRSADTQAALPLPVGSLMFTDVPGNPANQNAALSPYGSALLMAAQAAFFSPCENAPEFSFSQAASPSPSSGADSGSSTPTSNGANGGANAGIFSTQQAINPYIEWAQTIEYDQNNGTVILPASGGLAGRVYQIHSPYMIVRQWGHGVCVGAPVVPPQPQTVYNGIVRRKKITPLAPTPNPDKTTLTYSASWEYEILVPFQNSDLIKTPTNGQTFVDTPVGTNAGQLQIPSNSALSFNPASSNNLLALNLPIVQTKGLA